MGIYWLEKKKNLKGRDPLGVQAIGIHIYGLLIPGITNVTERLRYYSFFPWLFYQYQDQDIKKKYNLDLVQFLRRSEFLFAIISHYHHKNDATWSGHLVGTNTINLAFKDLDQNKSIILSKYTQLEKSEFRYFKNKLGGYGQYYQGVLRYLEILKRDKKNKINFFPKGIELAEAFNTGNRELFTSCIGKDEVNFEDLEKLSIDLCACGIKKDTREYELLKGILYDIDDPSEEQNSSHNRKNTIQLMLLLSSKFGKRTYPWDLLNLLYYKVDKKGEVIEISEKFEQISSHWIYYLRHEFFCIGLISLFVAIQYIFEGDELGIDEIVDRCWSKYINNTTINQIPIFLSDGLIKLKTNPTFSDIIKFLNKIRNNSNPWDCNIFNEMNLSNHLLHDRKNHALLFIAGIFLLVMSLKSELNSKYFKENPYLATVFDRYKINLNRFLNDYNNKLENKRLRNVLKIIIGEYIINRHIEVAHYKLYTEGIATYRFYREKNKYKYSGIDFDEVNNTNPRLVKTFQMLVDLGIMEKDHDGFFSTL